MGVYIKGMVMPYGCANCHFVSEPIYDAKGRATYVCNVPVEEVRGEGNTDEVFALYEGALEAFPDWCPIVEVPEPHGDLIDKSELMKRELGWYKERVVRMDESVRIFVNHAIQGIDKSPTVIEAEGE